MRTQTIIGASFGAAAMLLLLILAVCYYKRELRASRTKTKPQDERPMREERMYTIRQSHLPQPPISVTATMHPRFYPSTFEELHSPPRIGEDPTPSQVDSLTTVPRAPYTPSQHHPEPPDSLLRPFHHAPPSLPQDYSAATFQDSVFARPQYTPSHYCAEPPESVQRMAHLKPISLPQEYSAATLAPSPVKQVARG